MRPTENQPPINATPLCDAAQQTANWRDFNNLYLQQTANTTGNPPILGFHIPIDDINQILQYAVGGIKVYAALSRALDLTSVHLFIVPITLDGNDMLEINGQSIIYDTTMPCPVMCGTPNALNDDVQRNANCSQLNKDAHI